MEGDQVRRRLIPSLKILVALVILQLCCFLFEFEELFEASRVCFDGFVVFAAVAVVEAFAEVGEAEAFLFSVVFGDL